MLTTEFKAGNLVLITMVYLAWTDTGDRQSEEESYTCACNNIYHHFYLKKALNFFSHHIKYTVISKLPWALFFKNV